ncbi:hypothetical protein Tco_0506260, partial [Tanacetum coccineum]
FWIMDKSFLIAKGRGSGPSTGVSNEEPKSRDSVGGKHNVESAINPNLGTPTYVGPVSFATLLKGDTSRKSVNFHTLVTPAGNGANVVISKESLFVVNERLSNTVYGFFLGKPVSYPVIENCVKNTWSKFGLVKLMMTKDDDGNPLEKVDYPANLGIEDEVELVDNKVEPVDYPAIS